MEDIGDSEPLVDYEFEKQEFLISPKREKALAELAGHPPEARLRGLEKILNELEGKPDDLDDQFFQMRLKQEQEREERLAQLLSQRKQAAKADAVETADEEDPRIGEIEEKLRNIQGIF